MAWNEMSIEKLAHKLNVDTNEILEKQSLIRSIIHTRKKQKLSQVELAKKLGVTQGRVAQIESGVGTRKVTFDVLLHMLSMLGVDFHIVAKKRANRQIETSQHMQSAMG